jgi:hypothetical protein
MSSRVEMRSRPAVALVGSSSRPRSQAPRPLATSSVPVPTLPRAATSRRTRLPCVGVTYVTVPPVTMKLRINRGLASGGVSRPGLGSGRRVRRGLSIWISRKERDRPQKKPGEKMMCARGTSSR